jgi:hypothetical protein
MGFVYAVSSILGFAVLSLVFFLVLTPIALAARMCGRDRLRLRSGAGAWLPVAGGHDPQRQF